MDNRAAKTHDLMARGKMLDLLVCKAESYSHFIKSNLMAHGGHLERSRGKGGDSSDRDRDRILAGEEAASPSQSQSSRAEQRKRKGGGSGSPVAPPSHKGKKGKVESTQRGHDDDDYYALNKDIIVPELTGRLMEYQVEGIRWLASLWENGVSGILADEMGLGKTIQVISFLALLKHRNTKGPFLVVAPLATIPNWLKEFRKWLPNCAVVLYHGSREEREAIRRDQMPIRQQEAPSFPVIITSFEICMVDRAHLQNYYWKFLVLDEGHRIKNRNCRLVRELKQLQSATRLLLSGTPIQVSMLHIYANNM
jgi:ATP-dependent DNA helicase